MRAWSVITTLDLTPGGPPSGAWTHCSNDSWLSHVWRVSHEGLCTMLNETKWHDRAYLGLLRSPPDWQAGPWSLLTLSAGRSQSEGETAKQVQWDKEKHHALNCFRIFGPKPRGKSSPKTSHSQNSRHHMHACHAQPRSWSLGTALIWSALRNVIICTICSAGIKP